jgi:hypothetical protein
MRALSRGVPQVWCSRDPPFSPQAAAKRSAAALSGCSAPWHRRCSAAPYDELRQRANEAFDLDYLAYYSTLFQQGSERDAEDARANDVDDDTRSDEYTVETYRRFSSPNVSRSHPTCRSTCTRIAETASA